MPSKYREVSPSICSNEVCYIIPNHQISKLSEKKDAYSQEFAYNPIKTVKNTVELHQLGALET